MVKAFIIAETNCQVLYSSVFSFLDDADKRNDLVNIFVQNVKKEYDFNSAVSNNSSGDFSDSTVMDVESKGVFNIKVHEFQMPVVWHSFHGCLYILVCHNTENRILAASTLFFLIRTLRDNLPKITNTPSEFISKIDVVSLIVNTLLPSGQLLFLNNQATQQLAKDIQKALR